MTAQPTNEWNLHDATVDAIRFDWAKGRLEILLTVPVTDGPPARMITAEGVIMLRCPHREPWGPSPCINTVRGPGPIYREGKLLAVEIEMQSGDRIEVEAQTFKLEGVDNSASRSLNA